MLFSVVLIQFYPIDKTVKKIPITYDIFRQENVSEEVEVLIKNACYDCHSNETKYPDYSVYAPISWYIEYHIEEGRKNANFSYWKKYDKDQKNAIIKNSIETLESGSMPLNSYVKKHSEAILNSKDRILLIEWFKSIYK